MTQVQAIFDKVLEGRRITPEEGLRLLTEADLLALGQVAQAVRFRRYPEPVVTFVVDTNPNYTNVCVTDCLFCAFYRKPGAPDAYTLSVEKSSRRSSGPSPGERRRFSCKAATIRPFPWTTT